MEVIAIQKSALDGMKNELKALLEMTENATQKYTPIFKEEQWLDNQEVCLMMNITFWAVAKPSCFSMSS